MWERHRLPEGAPGSGICRRSLNRGLALLNGVGDGNSLDLGLSEELSAGILIFEL